MSPQNRQVAKEFLVTCCLAIIVLIALRLGIAAFGTSREMVLTNETSREITVSYSVKLRASSLPFSYDIPSGGTAKVGDVFDIAFTIATGNMEKRYGRVKIPAAATYKVAFHGFFEEARVKAMLKEDGCIYLSSAISSPSTGFPLCPYWTVEVPYATH